jgi:hypothetical protein
MKTNFYERTAYKLSSEPVPDCFLKLDEHFDSHLSSYEETVTHHCVFFAESLCSRMADIELYAFLMEDARKRHTIDRKEDEKAAILTRAFFLGLLGASKALLDSAATTLAALYELPLTGADRNFSNSDFWHQLVLHLPAVHRRYHPLRLFFNEVLQWCNGAAYHIPPLIALHSHYGRFPDRETQLKMLDKANVEPHQIAREPFRVTWVDPLQLYTRWKPRFLTLCERVCQDLEKNS